MPEPEWRWPTAALLREGTLVDAKLVAAPSSIKNGQQNRDPEMHQPPSQRRASCIGPGHRLVVTVHPGRR
jgi:hypothetical protein